MENIWSRVNWVSSIIHCEFCWVVFLLLVFEANLTNFSKLAIVVGCPPYHLITPFYLKILNSTLQINKAWLKHVPQIAGSDKSNGSWSSIGRKKWWYPSNRGRRKIGWGISKVLRPTDYTLGNERISATSRWTMSSFICRQLCYDARTQRLVKGRTP